MNNNNPHAHLDLGNAGEEAATNYLASLGYHILDRNWRHGRLELDIICEDGQCIVFVEVKTRHSAAYGGPQAAITPKKISNLLHAAQAWLAGHNCWDRSCRFDVLCLTGRNDSFKVEYYRNAIEFGHTVDSGDTSW